MRAVIHDAIRGRRAFVLLRRLLRVTDLEHDRRIVSLLQQPRKDSIDYHHSSKERDAVNAVLIEISNPRDPDLIISGEDVTACDIESLQSPLSSSSSSYSIMSTSSPRPLHKRASTRAMRKVPLAAFADANATVFGSMVTEAKGFAHLPRIDARSDSNIVTWTYCRVMLQSFGDRFRFRLDVFVGIVSALVLLLAAIALILAFSTSNGTRIFFSAFFLQVLLAVCVVLLFLITLSFEGSQWNRELAKNK
jgi:hypothetical protein